jgi:hypothetical protein
MAAHPYLSTFRALPQVIFVADLKGDPLFLHAFTGVTYKLTFARERTAILLSEQIPAISITAAVTSVPGKPEAAAELMLTHDAAARLVRALQLESSRLNP